VFSTEEHELHVEPAEPGDSLEHFALDVGSAIPGRLSRGGGVEGEDDASALDATAYARGRAKFGKELVGSLSCCDTVRFPIAFLRFNFPLCYPPGGFRAVHPTQSAEMLGFLLLRAVTKSGVCDG
jgi:hypothetical protein